MIDQHEVEELVHTEVILGHPLRRVGGEFFCMPLQFSEVIEGIEIIQFAGVNQAHIQITDVSAIQCLIKKRVLPVQDRFLQAHYTGCCQGSSRLAQKQSQRLPVPQHVIDGFA